MEAGYPDISEKNVGNWKHGGFADWLREQQQSEARLALPKALEHCLRSGQIDRIQQNALALAADHLMMIMGLFNPRCAVDALYEKPELFPRYIAALGSMARCSADLAKSFDTTQNRESIIREKLTAEDLTPTADPTTDEAEPLVTTKPHAAEPGLTGPTRPTCPTSPISGEPPTPRFDPNTEVPSTFRIPELSVEPTTTELLPLLQNAKNGHQT